MTTERIKEIQQGTAYPNSISVQQALLKVWNECEQENQVKNCSIPNVIVQSEQLFCNCEVPVDMSDEEIDRSCFNCGKPLQNN